MTLVVQLMQLYEFQFLAILNLFISINVEYIFVSYTHTRAHTLINRPNKTF